MDLSPEAMLIKDMDFSNRIVGSRIKNALAQNGIVTLSDLLELSEEDLLDMRNFGTTSLAELTVKIKRMGLELRKERTW